MMDTRAQTCGHQVQPIYICLWGPRLVGASGGVSSCWPEASGMNLDLRGLQRDAKATGGLPRTGCCRTWMFPITPVDSMRLATLTVLPQMS